MNCQAKAERAIKLAQEHAATTPDMHISALKALLEACGALDRSEWIIAYMKALRSLKFSVGTEHQAYLEAAGLV